MKISALHVSNFKRIHDVKIEPGVDRAVVLIGGKNGNGKSSLLDALTAAFGGKNAVPADPVRHGAETAEIRVELDGGAFNIKRTFKADGESLLEVRDGDGKIRSPQAVLDKLIGARFLDPHAFLQLAPAAQRKALLDVIDGDGKVAKLDARRERVFDRRTEVGRDHRKAAAELERMPDVTPTPQVDVAELLAQSKRIDVALGEVTTAGRARATARVAADAADREVAKLEEELQAVAARLEAAEQRRELARRAAEEADANYAQVELGAGDIAEQRKSVAAALANANDRNRQSAADEATVRRRKEVEVEVKRLAAEVAGHTAELDKIDAEKASILAAAALPVKGLDVDASGLRFNGVPFAQASGAEQLRVALALAIAAAPNLGDVWVKDASLLDDDSKLALEKEAAAAGVTVWAEVVGDRDPGVIVIHDGRRREEPARKSA